MIDQLIDCFLPTELIDIEQKQVCLVDGAIFSDFRIWNCIVDCVAANVSGKRWVRLQSIGKRVVAAAAGELCCSRTYERLMMDNKTILTAL